MASSRFFSQGDSFASGKKWDSDNDSGSDAFRDDDDDNEETMVATMLMTTQPTQKIASETIPTQKMAPETIPTQKMASEMIPTQTMIPTQLIPTQKMDTSNDDTLRPNDDEIYSSSPPATVPTQLINQPVVQVAASSPAKPPSTTTTPMRLPYSKAPGANNNIPSSPSSVISDFKVSDSLSQYQPFRQAGVSAPKPKSGLSGTITSAAMEGSGLSNSTLATTATTAPKRSPTIDLTNDAAVPYVASSDSEEDSAGNAIPSSTFFKSKIQEESSLDRMRNLTGKFSYNGANGSQGSGTSSQGPSQSKSQQQQQPSYIARKKVAQHGPQLSKRPHYDISKLNPVLKKHVSDLKQTFPNFDENFILQSLNEAKSKYNDALDALRTLEDGAKRLQVIVPHMSNETIYRVLCEKKNFDDAADELLKLDEGDDDLVEIERPPSFVEKSSKRNVDKAPKRTVIEKFSATQHRHDSPPSSPPPQSAAPAVAPARRRLVRGADRDKSASKPSTPIEIDSSPAVSEGEDSEAEEQEEEDAVTEWEVIKLINESDLPKLQDLAPAIAKEDLQAVLDAGPFDSMDQLRELIVSSATKKGTKTSRRKIGERVANSVMETYTGLRAVDIVVEKCLKMSERARGVITSWGGNIHNGELRIVDVPSDETIAGRQQDSGIGTPSNAGEPSLRNSVLSSDPIEADIQITSVRRKIHNFIRTQPESVVDGISLKDYQMVGFNWLYLLFKENLSCILADEMGLGKTFQIIAFLAYLKEQNIPGPHLVVVPATTLENWLREFNRFCPNVHVEPYHGTAAERTTHRDYLQRNRNFDVLVTTYSMAQGGEGRDAKQDAAFLKSFPWNVGVYDEGHMLKNSNSARYRAIAKIRAKHRILLTGTPIQNNLQELVSLLAFLYPHVFSDHQEELGAVFKFKASTSDANSNNSALLSQQRINKARNMTGIVILRRRKVDVLKSLPPKVKEIQYCDMTPSQKELYASQEAAVRKMILDRQSGVMGQRDSQSNALMLFRKAALHPLLFRRLYTDETVAKMALALYNDKADFNSLGDRNLDYVREDLEVMTDFELNRYCRTMPRVLGKYALKNEPWMDAGKVLKLKEILRKAQEDGDRVLIFSQFVMCLDVLESVMSTLGVPFLRMDGSTNVQLRQDLIDQYHNETDITAFLLSTKAGGFGINLACANLVVIFDCSFNPTDDLQSEDRAHRVGQTRPVKVIRLISRGTVEESILNLANTKMALDKSLSGGVEEETSEKESQLTAAKGEEMVFNMMKEKLLSGGGSDDKEAVMTDREVVEVIDDEEDANPRKGKTLEVKPADEDLLAPGSGGRRSRSRNTPATSEFDSDASEVSRGSKRKVSDDDAMEVEESTERSSKLRRRNPPSNSSSQKTATQSSQKTVTQKSSSSSQKSASSSQKSSSQKKAAASAKNGNIKNYFK